MDRTTIFWAIIGIILILLFLFSLPSFRISHGEVKLVIDYGDGKKRTFVTNAKQEITAWDLLQHANAKYDVDMEIESGFLPKRINGLRNGDNGKRWNWYKDGSPQNSAPIEAIISGGEEVVFRFE
jgi:hypothetical protein